MIATVHLTAKIPLTLEPQPEGGYTVTSPVLPELITEGNTVEEVLENVQDCFAVVLDIYEDMDRSLPIGLVHVNTDIPATPANVAVAVS